MKLETLQETETRKQETPRCSNCVYYTNFPPDEEPEDDDEDAVTGYCRRYPPRAVACCNRSVWAEVRFNKWCGEHLPH